MKQKRGRTCAILVGTIFSVSSTLISLNLKEVIDVARSGDINRVISIVIQTTIYIVALGACYWLYATFSKKFVCKVTKMLRSAGFDGIFKRNISDLRTVNSADYLSALTNDVKNVEENYFVPLLLCLQNIIVFIASMAVMIYLSPLVMLCLFVAVILLIALPSLFQTAIQNRQNSFSVNQSNFPEIGRASCWERV